MASVRYDQAALATLLTSPSGAVATDLLRRGRNVENRAKRLLSSGPTQAVDTGRLRASITHEIRNESGLPVCRVGTNVNYALYVHEGTGVYGPHHRPIRPRRAKVLRFKVGRRVVYARQVRGAKPRPFLRAALPAALD